MHILLRKYDLYRYILYRYSAISLYERVDAMEGKVLLFIRDTQLRMNLLKSFTESQISFIEVQDMSELEFKMSLAMELNRLYVHEFSSVDEEGQFELLERMKKNNWKLLVIFPEYSVRYIDQAQGVAVDDLMAQPVHSNVLLKKVKTLLSLPVEESSVSVVDSQSKTVAAVVFEEINRADRGRYDLSFVMVSVTGLSAKERQVFLKDIKGLLRETDKVLIMEDLHNCLIVCPFTTKEFLVNVENKVRVAFDKVRMLFGITARIKLYLHGLTYPVDGENFDVIKERLLEGIRESKVFDQTIIPQSQKIMNKRIQEMHRRYNRYY